MLQILKKKFKIFTDTTVCIKCKQLNILKQSKIFKVGRIINKTNINY